MKEAIIVISVVALILALIGGVIYSDSRKTSRVRVKCEGHGGTMIEGFDKNYCVENIIFVE